MAWTIQIQGLEALEAKGHDAIRDGLVRGMEALGVVGEGKVQDNIRSPFGSKPPAVASGNLASSIESTVIPDQDAIRLTIGVSARLGADEYAPAVEDGSKPHMAPFDALDSWVLLKFHPETEEDARRIANGVLRKIYHHGTRPHKMFERALPELEPMAAPIVERELAQAFLRAGFTGGAQ